LNIKELFLLIPQSLQFYFKIWEEIFLRPNNFFKRIKEEKTYLNSSKFLLISSILYIMGFLITLLKHNILFLDTPTKAAYTPNTSVVIYMLINVLIAYIVLSLVYAILLKLCFKFLKSQITFTNIVNVFFYCTHTFIFLGLIWPQIAIPLFTLPKQINIEISPLWISLLTVIWFYTCLSQIHGLNIISSIKLYKVVISYFIISVLIFTFYEVVFN
jgi:hypothetical protein